MDAKTDPVKYPGSGNEDDQERGPAPAGQDQGQALSNAQLMQIMRNMKQQFKKVSDKTSS